MPYTFRALSDAIGALRILSVDEFTYYAEGAPKVTNAAVKITDAITGTVFNTNTGPTGDLLLPALVESYYYVDVTAEKHSSFRDLVRLEPGTTNMVTALMSRQSVTYTWTVVPIQIEDRYTITVETTFETAVPKPVVTIEPNIIDLANFVGTEQQINLTLRNHGLIAAQNTKLSFPTHSRWSFTPLIGDVGVLPAQSTLVIPLTIRKLNLAAASGGLITAAGTGDACSLPAKVEWETPCGDTSIKNSISLGIISMIPACGGMGSSDDRSFTSDIWDGIGGGSSGGGGPTELRAKEDGEPIFHDVPYKCDPCEQARFNWVVLHCFPKLIPGKDWYDLISDTASGGAAAASGGPILSAAGGASGGLRQCLKEQLADSGVVNPDCIGMGKAASEGKTKDAILNGVKCTTLPKCTPGGGSLMWAIECELELMELVECKDRGIGGLASASDPIFTAASDGVISFVDPVIPPFDSAAPLLLANLRVHKLLRPVEYFYGDRAWLDATNDFAANELWESRLQAAVETNSPSGVFIDASERATLLSGALPVPLATATRFLDRINRTLDYADRGITTVAQVPAGESRDFIVMSEFARLIDEAQQAAAAIAAEGYDNPADSFINANVEYLNRLSQDGGGAVCARVKVRLDQDAVLTRDAFNARLEISNDTEAPLTEFGVDIRVRDEQGRDTTSLFQLRAPELTGIGAIDGTGNVGAQSTARASWVLVPTSEAAPFGTVRHFVSGTLRYRQNDVLVNLPLANAPIDVLPNPKLVVKYFHERDVFSDDPFTPELEPAIPYSLAVMVDNEGFGTARQMRITSAQPQIVENDKGLLIDFEILGSRVENQPGSPSLTVNLGDIGPGTNAIARWLFRSTLQGLFIDYAATFEHIDGLGDKRLSLIDRVEIHEMIHIVSADRTFEDNRPDFLVNDVPDFDDYPDTIHLSSGGTQPVVVYTEGTPANLVTPYQPTTTLTVPSAPGWAYFRLPDPANGSTRLVSVRRANGTEVPPQNFWVTDRTFLGLGLPPRREFRLNLLDSQPDGPYTLTYESAAEATDQIPPVSRVNALPANSAADFAVTWDGSDVGRGVAAFDLFMRENNGAFTPYLTATPLKGLVFRGQPGIRYAFYTIAIDEAGNRESAPSTPDTETLVSISNRPPALVLPGTATIDEGDTLALEAAGTDPDAPAQALTYQIITAPAGLTLNPNSGAIAWVTGEGNGPSTNLVSVRVTDNGIPSLSATASVTVVVNEINQSPVLDPVATRIINKGIVTTIPFTARDPDLPANRLTFALGAGAPVGASIDPTNGVFSWRPGNNLPNSTNRITVTVTDSGTPSRSASQTLTLILRNRSADFTVAVGSTNVFAGESNAVPVRLTTGVELRDLAVVVNRSGGRLDGLSLGTFAPEVTSALLETVSSNASRLRFQFDGLIAASNHPLANLRFVAPTNGPSTIVGLTPTNAVATDYAGVTLNRAGSSAGMVVIVGREPVLLARLTPERSLRLYGRPGVNYTIESKPGFSVPAPWERWTQLVLTDRFADINVSESAPYAVFRAAEAGSALRLEAHRESGPVYLTVSGEPGPGYRLEGASVLAPVGNWQTLTTFTLSNDNQVLNLTPTNLPNRFFRIVKP